MTSRKAPDGERAAANGAVTLDRFSSVVRT
jgi:hypothetical protein